MGSFAALHLEAPREALVPHIDEWAKTENFAAVEAFSEPPPDLSAFHLGVRALGLAELNQSWCILYANGFSLPAGGQLSARSIEPLALRCACRALLFVAQTTSDCYELALFDAGRRVRHLGYADGARLHDEGAPLPGETGNTFCPVSEWNEDEDIPTPMDDAHAICNALGFDLWQGPVVRGSGHIWRRRGLLSRWFGGR